MYSGYGFRKSEIGDVDVVVHNGEYHLFHLTLPNHDYIAHAVSKDGLHWRRVKNALFISDPPAWDDDMLWTMHVSRNPYQPGSWRMFYTGLSMEERGRVQRLGLAVSDDLYDWRKVNQGAFPLEAQSPHYESTVDEGRNWVSFRDPCFFEHDGKGCLVVSARVPHGPIIRRGCVALLKESVPNHFELQAPIFHPMRYDDLEVPSLVRLRDRYYLICSIREDVKIHYWYADQLEGPYRNLADNVLLPQGNYAARICQDGDRYLVWNFFYKGLKIEGIAPDGAAERTGCRRRRPTAAQALRRIPGASLLAARPANDCFRLCPCSATRVHAPRRRRECARSNAKAAWRCFCCRENTTTSCSPGIFTSTRVASAGSYFVSTNKETAIS